MKVAILGGGGNAAEALGGLLELTGHEPYFFRFPNQVDVPGTPKRPKRSSARLDSMQFSYAKHLDLRLPNSKYRWITASQIEEFSVVFYCFPSYLVNHTVDAVGKFLKGKVLINISDRALGTYSIISRISNKFGPQALPRLAIAFNGVPIMAQRSGLDSSTTVFLKKSSHTISCYPGNQSTEAKAILEELLGISPTIVNFLPSLLHLTFQNVHSIEHSVVDLENLRFARYATAGRLYSDRLYTPQMLERINAVTRERDAVAWACMGLRYFSIAQYDQKVFPSIGVKIDDVSGTAEYRQRHDLLKDAPSPSAWNAVGFEDVGWAMVTLEDFGRHAGVATPELGSLIDDWHRMTGVNYRQHGRTLRSIGLTSGGSGPFNVARLNWNPNILPAEMVLSK
jgi:hypothetical protein